MSEWISETRCKELKEKALNYAKIFKETGDIKLNLEENLSQAEWYITLQLAQTYYNLMCNIIDRETAKQEQRDVFKYAMTL